MRNQNLRVMPAINMKSNRVEKLDTISRSPFRLQIASDQDTAAIDRLRVDAYNGAGYFKIPQPERVMIQSDPSNSFCFIVTDGERLAATIRVAFAASRAEGRRIIELEPPQRAVEFPGVALCRGATHKDFRGLGLMTFLVSVGVSVAFKAGLRSAIAAQAIGTPHFGAMIRAGWQSIEVSGGNARDVSFDSSTRVKLIYLMRAALTDSYYYSEREHADLHDYLRVGDALSQAVRRVPTGLQELIKEPLS